MQEIRPFEPWFFILFGLFHLHRVWGLLDRESYAAFWLGVLTERGAFYWALMAALGGLDAVVFTAGVGENTPHIRASVLADMQAFGIEIDAKKNEYKNDGAIHEISADTSKVKVLVIPTNEELVIARETAALL